MTPKKVSVLRKFNMIIRKIKKCEINNAARIIGKNYSKIYEDKSKIEIDAMFKKEVFPTEYIVAEEKGKIVGLAGYNQSWIDYHVYSIFWVNVEPGYQNKGIGIKLVRDVIKKIKDKKGDNKYASLIILSTKTPNYYSKHFGFKIIDKFGKKKNNYLMSLKL